MAAEVLARICRTHPMLGAMLDHATSARIDGDRLCVRFAQGEQALARSLERRENISRIEGGAREVAGRRLRVCIEVEPRGAATAARPAAPEPPAVETTPSPPSSVNDAAAPPSRGRNDELLAHAQREPGVQKLLREFGARVVEISALEPTDDVPPPDKHVGPPEEPR